MSEQPKKTTPADFAPAGGLGRCLIEAISWTDILPTVFLCLSFMCFAFSESWRDRIEALESGGAYLVASVFFERAKRWAIAKRATWPNDLMSEGGTPRVNKP